MVATLVDSAVRERTAELLNALGSAPRITILDLFRAVDDEPVKFSAKELAATLGMPLSNASYHVKVLREAGLIEVVETAPRRGAIEKWHSLTDAGVRALDVVEHAESNES